MAVLKTFQASSRMTISIVRDHGVVEAIVPGADHPLSRRTLQNLLEAMPER